MTHGLSKRERICSVTAVEALLSNGHYVVSGPLRCCFSQREDEYDLNRIMVTVPKKFFKRAVKRNLLKRRIREAYRLQKELLEARRTDIMFVYTSKDISDFATIRDSVASILTTVNGRLLK